MANITYKRTFQHEDWIDNEDVVQAGGEKGFNVKFHGLEAEFDDISGVIAQLSAGLGAFQPLGGGTVAYTGGNVGIGSGFSSTSPPTYRLEVNLADNSGAAEQVRFGNVVCSNGGAAGVFGGYAVFSHKKHALDSNYALRQGPNGNVHINAVSGRQISFCQNGDDVKLGISATGKVVVGDDVDQPGAGTALLQVRGDAFSTTGKWLGPPSDARVKEDVRELEAGLAQLLKMRPVRFRYNGRAGTTAGQEAIGVLAQEIEKIFPEMIRLVTGGVEGDPDINDLRIYDASVLPFVLVNAVKELAGKVEELEQALAEARKDCGANGSIV